MAGRHHLTKAINYTWYLVQLAIWPLIRDTTCVYCIFIRGALCGTILGASIIGAFWLNA